MTYASGVCVITAKFTGEMTKKDPREIRTPSCAFTLSSYPGV